MKNRNSSNNSKSLEHDRKKKIEKREWKGHK